MANSDSPIAWYGSSSAGDRRTFWACFGGWTLDALNFFIFFYAFSSVLKVVFAISPKEAWYFTLLPAIASAIGGWAAGALSDRYGRVRILQITILWFAAFTLLCAVAQDHWQLLTFRTLMGFGLGGEWAVGAALLGETIRAKDRGKAVGTMESGWGIGWGLTAIIAIPILFYLPQYVGWRVLFCIGLLPALLVFYLRRHIDDAPVFKETQKKLAAKKQKPNFLEIFSPALLKTTALTTLLTIGVYGGYFATSELVTLMRNEQKVEVMASRWYTTGLIVASIVGYLASAYLNDRIGRRMNFLLFAACSAVGVFALTFLTLKDMSTIILFFVVFFFASGTFSGLGPALAENFPTRIRGSGMGFAYNSGRLIAAIVPWTIVALSARSPMGRSIDLVAIVAYGLVIVAGLLLPETNGKKLVAG